MGKGTFFTTLAFVSGSFFVVGSSFGSSTPPAPPRISYSSTPVVGHVGSGLSVKASITGTVTSCTTSPPLPQTLSIKSTNCVISGTPRVPMDQTRFTVTAANSGGSATASFSLTIAAVPTLSYSAYSTGAATQSVTINPTSLAANGGKVETCTISPGLPSGLVINSGTCVISGTPKAILKQTKFTVTATNTYRLSTKASFNLTINPAPAPVASPSAASVPVPPAPACTPSGQWTRSNAATGSIQKTNLGIVVNLPSTGLSAIGVKCCSGSATNAIVNNWDISVGGCTQDNFNTPATYSNPPGVIDSNSTQVQQGIYLWYKGAPCVSQTASSATITVQVQCK